MSTPMDIEETILATVSVLDRESACRTVIQKLLYFESILGLTRLDFLAHYYGPYSSEVAGTIEELVSLGFLKENVLFYSGLPVKKYSYSLTKEGEELLEQFGNKKSIEAVKRLADICRQTVGLSPNALSLAAKIHFILSMEKRGLTSKEIAHLADSYEWKIAQEEIDSSAQLLLKLGLCEEKH